MQTYNTIFEKGDDIMSWMMLAAEAAQYEGWAEAPGIIKYMIFSIIGIVILSIIAGIYCAVKPPRRRK